MMVANNQPLIVVDGHVHLHDPASLAPLLDRARANFAHFCPQADQGVLLLARTSSSPDFKTVCTHFEQTENNSGWILHPTSQIHGWRAMARDGSQLWLITGHQLVTAEGLEVLVFGWEEGKNGMGIEEILSRAHKAHALTILPWGVGKWLGGRGNIVSRLLKDTPAVRIVLGDNGGRPTLWAHIGQFSQARKLNIPILRGTDSLPLKGELNRVGSFGTIIPGTLDPDTPASSFTRLLHHPALAMDDFGNTMGLHTFLKNQILLRLRKEPGPVAS